MTFLTVLLIYLDPFKVFFQYEDYNDTFVTLNRTVVTTQIYKNNKKQEHFDSFIFGSSRSQAFKAVKWKNYLEENSSPFHFSANSEGLYGIFTKIQYLYNQGDTIKNALIILNGGMIKNTEDNKTNLDMSVPEVSNNSAFDFYLINLKASFSRKFLIAYIDYFIFRKYRSYMSFVIMNDKYPHINDPKNGDIWYGYDAHIAADSIGYYKKIIASGVFFERKYSSERQTLDNTVTDKGKEQLMTIKSIFDKHKTKYKIVINPMYDQVLLENTQLNLLQSIFGKENVYDFSGKNELSEPIANFYESSHFRPHVADSIMKVIYKK